MASTANQNFGPRFFLRAVRAKSPRPILRSSSLPRLFSVCTRSEPETKSRQWQVPQIKTLGQDSSCARCEPNHRDQSSDHRPCHVCSASAPLMTNPVKGRAVVLGQIRDDTITGNYTDNKSTCGRRNEVFTLSP